MPIVTIDGIQFEYEGKHRLLPFALENGIEIPYFCYHPAMSSPTNCRMCLVDVGFQLTDRETKAPLTEADGSPKIGWGRKPTTACNTDLAPGMFVRTNRTSPAIEKAQKGVLEFLLINHPLDCPICDQAGECPLQINTYKYGPEGSRYELSKVHKPKRIQLGPNVMLDAERCINCTRCVRFTEEISGTAQLSIISRGDKNFPSTGPGKTFDDAYSMNVVDICPVGALTSADFRFKARVWEMNYTPSICTGCSRGCSDDVWVRDNSVMRLTPRENQAVNKYWMCDAGRLDYVKYNEGRVSGVKKRGDLPLPFLDGMAEAARLLTANKGKTLFVGSAYASFESNYALKKLAEATGVKEIYYVQHNQAGWGDNFLKKDDRTPNAASCELLGFKAVTVADLKQKASGASLVYLMEDDGVATEVISSGKPVIVQAYNHFAGHENAELLLPAATSTEAAGTYINCDSIPQQTMQARQIARMTPEMWMAMPKSRLDAGGVAVDNWRHTENIIDCLPGWMMIAKIAEGMGIDLGFGSYEAIFNEIKGKYEVLSSLKLAKRNRKESFKISQFEFAIN